MDLLDVYGRHDRHALLYDLLKERDETINISHRSMPELDDHIAFVESKPYSAWYFIEVTGDIIGACYLSRLNEIGVFIFRVHQGRRFGAEAVALLMKKHGPGRYLANCNPKNERSMMMFDRMGFKVISLTMELVA